MVLPYSLGESSRIALTVAIVARMLFVGFFREPGRIFSWPMFTRGCSIEIDLVITDGVNVRAVKIFEVLPPGEFAISSSELQHVVDYTVQPGETASGKGRMFWANGETPILIEGSRVVI